MERKQGFFSVVRGLSPGRSRAKSPARSASPMSRSLRPAEALSPLKEGPDQDDGGDSRMEGKWGHWMKGQLSRGGPSSVVSSSSNACNNTSKRSDLRLLLGVLGAPLAPVHVSTAEPLPHLSIKDTPIETSSAQYILQQYTAASGGQRLQNSIHNAYAMGKICGMLSLHLVEARFMPAAMGSSCGGIHLGLVRMLLKGPVRPLRRALQGLDPRTTASMFTNSRCIGEKKINGDDCFILKICADPATLKARSEGPAEIIRHVLFGYFSQKTGLLVHLEDSHLTRIQNNGGDAVYWETTINSFLDDYRLVDGIMIAHSGRSVVTLFRFGDTAMSHTRTRMEEAWAIEEVAFNVPGLSMDCFIPPAELRFASVSETCELPRSQRVKPAVAASSHRAKGCCTREIS
ncbi:hypothetical protein OIU76_006322 [Salix suchowensis]|nr:hypothetical protein OIU76_006322 [Salix suchowensis]